MKLTDICKSSMLFFFFFFFFHLNMCLFSDIPLYFAFFRPRWFDRRGVDGQSLFPDVS